MTRKQRIRAVEVLLREEFGYATEPGDVDWERVAVKIVDRLDGSE